MLEYQSLSKSDKVIIRKLHETGVKRRMEEGLEHMLESVEDWKAGKEIREVWKAIYAKMETADNGIARLYDGLTGSRYIQCVWIELQNGYLKEEDLKQLSEPIREYFDKLMKLSRQ